MGGEEESNPTSKIQACKKNKEKIKNWYPLSSHEEIKSKNVFQRFAIYNSLQVKIKKEGTIYGNHYIEYSIGAGSKYKRRRRSTRSVSCSGGGFGRVYNKRIYQGTRRLDSYNIIANFFAYDNGNQSNSYRWTLFINRD